jgi:hypothetical protein
MKMIEGTRMTADNVIKTAKCAGVPQNTSRALKIWLKQVRRLKYSGGEEGEGMI